jgi:hypothetical protein
VKKPVAVNTKNVVINAAINVLPTTSAVINAQLAKKNLAVRKIQLPALEKKCKRIVVRKEHLRAVIPGCMLARCTKRLHPTSPANAPLVEWKWKNKETECCYLEKHSSKPILCFYL